MPAEPSEAQLKEAVLSLRRVSTADEPGRSGEHTVFHLGFNADLITHLNHAGQLVRQELTLFADHFVWVRDRGLMTGRVSKPVAAGTTHTAEVLLDVAPADRDARIARGLSSLEQYEGDDRFVRHAYVMLLDAAAASAPASAVAARPVALDELRAAAGELEQRTRVQRFKTHRFSLAIVVAMVALIALTLLAWRALNP